MVIWFYNKETEEPDVYGSLTAVAQNTDLDIDDLYKHFSLPVNKEEVKKNKKVKKIYNKSYEDDKYFFVKKEIIRSKKTNN